jgi:hypothetical protein
MALVFDFSPIVIRKAALQACLVALEAQGNSAAITFAKNLLNGDLVDDYLVGMDETADPDDFTHDTLQLLGLIWHDGTQCVDYYVPDSYPAPWLKTELSGWREAFYHVDDAASVSK